MDIKSTHEANANMSEARTIDIIAVHGLDEFDARGKCSDSSWEDPLDKELDGGWLGASVREICGKSAKFTIRLFFYTFDSTNTFCASADGLSNEAYSLLEQICMNRSQEATNNPIVFLGQGLGGLLVKQALLNAFLSSDFCQVKRWTKGLAFFGTPHSRESELRSGSHKGFFESLFCSTAPGLQIPPTLSNDFRHQLEDFLYISFYGNNDEIVPFGSETLNLPGNRETRVRLMGSHEDLCHFSVKSDNYTTVTRSLWRLCDRIAGI